MKSTEQTSNTTPEVILVTLYCMACNKPFEGPEPKMCCSGRNCGCMGMPIDPVVCSDECMDKILNPKKL